MCLKQNQIYKEDQIYVRKSCLTTCTIDIIPTENIEDTIQVVPGKKSTNRVLHQEVCEQ